MSTSRILILVLCRSVPLSDTTVTISDSTSHLEEHHLTSYSKLTKQNDRYNQISCMKTSSNAICHVAIHVLVPRHHEIRSNKSISKIEVERKHPIEYSVRTMRRNVESISGMVVVTSMKVALKLRENLS